MPIIKKTRITLYEGADIKVYKKARNRFYSARIVEINYLRGYKFLEPPKKLIRVIFRDKSKALVTKNAKGNFSIIHGTFIRAPNKKKKALFK